MFSDELEHISWEETTARIHAKTDADVRRALSKEHCNVEDFMALISPAAEPFLEEMAQLSHRYTLERFGKTISMYIPLYVSNACANCCVYCGFNHNNPLTRVTLTMDDDSELECRILTIFDLNEADYIVLLPLDENGEDNEEGEVFIYRYFENEDGEPRLEDIEDEEEYEAVADRFEELLDEAEWEELVDDN